MIDHVSIAVRDLAASTSFYELALSAIGLSKLVEREGTVGFGKRYPEFWINSRPEMEGIEDDTGVHICLRAGSPAEVDSFHGAALEAGGADDGGPGERPEYGDGYYAAFVRDPDGNRIEVVRFTK